MRLDLSGKGINVSRALRLLGVPSRIIAFLGGGTGRAIRDGLAADGFETICVEVADETRQNITVVDEAAGVLTKINEPGAAVSPADLAALVALIERLAAAGDLWVFSGSLPPGAPSDFYARLVTLVQACAARAFLDSSGEALRQGLAARPYAIKPNSEEAGEALGHPVVSDDDHVAALRWFQDNGSHLVCLTRGARGMVLALDGVLLSAAPPPINAASPIGAGDATLAGLVWAVTDGCDSAKTARRAVACGTAAAMQEGTGVGDRMSVEQLLREVRITRVSK